MLSDASINQIFSSHGMFILNTKYLEHRVFIWGWIQSKSAVTQSSWNDMFMCVYSFVTVLNVRNSLNPEDEAFLETDHFLSSAYMDTPWIHPDTENTIMITLSMLHK